MAPAPCRYHYNVSTDRLLSHVKKGWDQGLFISSATSNADLWALVMDEATGYSTQSFKVCDTFLPKTWCMAQWDAGMYITAVAGAQLSCRAKTRHACKRMHAGVCTRRLHSPRRLLAARAMIACRRRQRVLPGGDVQRLAMAAAVLQGGREVPL